MNKPMLAALLSIAALTGPAATSEATPLPPKPRALVEPASGSGIASTAVFRITSFDPAGTSPDPAQLIPFLELWDLTASVQHPFSAAPDPAKADQLLVTPDQQLVAQHEYGLRIAPGSDWVEGEISRHYIGTRPRVTRVHFKGGRTLYLSLSEPLDPATVAQATTLTNTVTGATINATVQGKGAPSRELAFELDGTKLDVSAPHIFRIAKNAAPSPGLDGAFSMPGGAPADFELSLSAAEVEVFVNGYGVKGDLVFECHRHGEWYDDESGKAVATPESCRPFGSPPATADDDGGCGVRPIRTPVSPAIVLLVLLGLAALRRR